jgi:hypothetical protein
VPTTDVHAQSEVQAQIVALRMQLQQTKSRADEAMRGHRSVQEMPAATRTLDARARRSQLGLATASGTDGEGE